MNDPANGQRLDKWLWAARFFKTRSAAGAAVSGGKVTVDGIKPKPARQVRPGVTLVIERGLSTFEVVVKGLCSQRRRAREAMLMYEETPDSQARRRDQAARRAQAEQRRQRALGRPERDERRELSRLKGRL